MRTRLRRRRPGRTSAARSSASSSSSFGQARPSAPSRSRWPPRAAAPCGPEAGPGRLPGTSWKMPSRPSSSRLMALPVAQHGRRVVGLHGAEDVRVAAHQLLADAVRDAGQVARTGLPGEQRQEVGLKQQVAELVDKLGGPAARPAPPRRPRRPPRWCAARWSRPSARGPMGSSRAGGPSRPRARSARRPPPPAHARGSVRSSGTRRRAARPRGRARRRRRARPRRLALAAAEPERARGRSASSSRRGRPPARWPSCGG